MYTLIPLTINFSSGNFSSGNFSSGNFSSWSIRLRSRGLCSLVAVVATILFLGHQAHGQRESVKFILSISNTGISAPMLQIPELDGTVFFYNNSDKHNVDIQIKWGNHEKHCASHNFKFNDDKILQTTSPLKPKDFGVICFPDQGEYEYTVTSRPKQDTPSDQVKMLKGKIIVQP
jgi:hypothetical protein